MDCGVRTGRRHGRIIAGPVIPGCSRLSITKAREDQHFRADPPAGLSQSEYTTNSAAVTNAVQNLLVVRIMEGPDCGGM